MLSLLNILAEVRIKQVIGGKMKRVIFPVIVAILLVIPMIGCPAAKPQETIELNFVTFTQTTSSEWQYFKPRFIDKINEEANGELVINFRGGPEVVAPNDIALAVQEGTFDIAMCAATFYEGLVPGARTIQYANVPPWELREGEGWDFLQQIHEEAGLYLLSWPLYTDRPAFYIFMRKEITSLEDLEGVKIGANPTFNGLLEGIGANPFPVPLQEYFSSVERGVADGVITSMHQWVGVGGHEITKCVIDHPFYRLPTVIILNYDVWNSLPDHLKELFESCAEDTEMAYSAVSDEDWVKERETMMDAGNDFVTFSPEDAERFLELARNECWTNEQIEQPSLDVARIRELLTQ
jgi:TRAP-type C4-dicarboxylate transport system substrate-binding protein